MWFMVCHWQKSQEGDRGEPFVQVSPTWALSLSDDNPQQEQQ